jgi:hypothetical protein
VGTSATDLERRVVRAAEDALAERQFVAALDVLMGLGWLAPSHVEAWQQGRVDALEDAMSVNPAKRAAALRVLQRWASDRGLMESEISYVARTPDRRTLRFSESGESAVERMYRTQWISPQLSTSRRERLVQKQSRPPDLVVVMPLNEWSCTACEGTGSMLIMDAPGPLCLTCADLDHLVFLPAGDAALTRRAKSASRLSAVVVRFSRARKRYERQGVLVEEAALERAEEECLADVDVRARRRERDAESRVLEDAELRRRFALQIGSLFPGCPAPRAEAIAARAAARGSGRVGRTAAGRAADPAAIELAVIVSVRHEDTGYDELLMTGATREEARERVSPEVEGILEDWRTPPAGVS